MENREKNDTYSYKGWLISDSFLKRVLAVIGYHIVGQLLISAIIFIVMIFIMIVFGAQFFRM